MSRITGRVNRGSRPGAPVVCRGSFTFLTLPPASPPAVKAVSALRLAPQQRFGQLRLCLAVGLLPL